jgi:hypothetical protein
MKTTKFLFLSLLAFNFLFSQQRECEWFLCNSFKEISSFYELNDKVDFGSTSFNFIEINKELKTLTFNSSEGLKLHLIFGKDDFIIEGELFTENKTLVKQFNINKVQSWALHPKDDFYNQIINSVFEYTEK